MLKYRKFLAVAFVASVTTPAIAEDEYAPVCEHKGSNGMVTMMLCPEGLKLEQLAKEGQMVCGDRKPCGVWIWENEADVPDEAPNSHDKLTEKQITSSRGVWMHEHQQFIEISEQQ